MKRDTSETVASSGEKVVTVRSSPVSLGLASAHDVPSNSVMDALLSQVLEGDQEAWAAVEQCLGETVHSWLQVHPSKEAACRWESEEYYVSLAFGYFRQTLTTGQLRACTSLPTVLRYLQACLNGALLDTLRAYRGPKGIALQEFTHLEEYPGGDNQGTRQLWEGVQRLFPDPRERRMAYLLFHGNLSSREIFCLAPQEFRNVQEICHLRAYILERILRHSDLIP